MIGTLAVTSQQAPGASWERFEALYRATRSDLYAYAYTLLRDRELIALKFHAGLSNAELARVLGISESNAGTMLHRTMEKLRKACNATA